MKLFVISSSISSIQSITFFVVTINPVEISSRHSQTRTSSWWFCEFHRCFPLRSSQLRKRLEGALVSEPKGGSKTPREWRGTDPQAKPTQYHSVVCCNISAWHSLSCRLIWLPFPYIRTSEFGSFENFARTFLSGIICNPITVHYRRLSKTANDKFLTHTEQVFSGWCSGATRVWLSQNTASRKQAQCRSAVSLFYSELSLVQCCMTLRFFNFSLHS